MGNACDALGPWVNMQSVILNAAERSEESKSAANKRFFVCTQNDNDDSTP
jgi:hypothetical protein